LHKDKFFYKIAWLMTKNTKKMAKPVEKKSLREKLAKSLGAVPGAIKSKMPAKWQPRLTKRNFIITVVVLFFLVQCLQVSQVTGGISSLSMKGSSLVDEVGQLNEMTSLLAQDLTEVRSFLLMPTRQYVSSTETSDEQDSENVNENENELQVALFKYVGFLGEQETLKQNLAINRASLEYLISNSDFAAFLKEKNLKIPGLAESDKEYSLSISDSAGTGIVRFYLEKETSNMYRSTINSLDAVGTARPEDFAEISVKQFLNNNLSAVSAAIKKINETKFYIAGAFSAEAVASLLKAENLTFASEPQDKEGVLYYDIKNVGGEVVAQVVFNKKDLSITLNDTRDEENIVLQVTDLATALPPFIGKLDVLPAVQKKVIEAQLQLKETFEDKGFKLLLEQAGLYIETSPREDEYRYFYDIKLGDAAGGAASGAVSGAAGTLLGSVVIEKSSGMVEVVDPSGAGTTNLLFFEDGLKKKL